MCLLKRWASSLTFNMPTVISAQFHNKHIKPDGYYIMGFCNMLNLYQS